MATTHALLGAAVAVLFVGTLPAHGDVAVLLAFLGGLFPDFDLYAGHRKTLHFPVAYWLALVGALALSTVGFTPATVGLVFFLLGAALHSTMDIFGGGLELRPWESRSERAVYNHVTRAWHRPRRWIRYDGAPEDAALATLLAIPTFVVTTGPVELLVAGAVLLSLAYALVRRHVPLVTERAVALVPPSLVGYLPERFTDA